MPHWPGELGRVDPDRNGPARTAAASLDEAKAAFRAAWDAHGEVCFL
jgi:hypothetical protein